MNKNHLHSDTLHLQIRNKTVTNPLLKPLTILH